MSNIDFVLSDASFAFVSTLSLDPTVETVTVTPLSGADAAANIDISLSALYDTFFVATDAEDLANAASTDLRYDICAGQLDVFHVSASNYSTFASDPDGALKSAGRASITSGGFTEVDVSTRNVSENYVRSLAKDIFGVAHGADILNNEENLKRDIYTILGEALNNQMIAALEAMKTAAVSAGSYQTHDTCFNTWSAGNGTVLGQHAGDYSVTDHVWISEAYNTGDNIPRELFRQVLKSQPGRLNLDDVVVDAVNRVIYSDDVNDVDAGNGKVLASSLFSGNDAVDIAKWLLRSGDSLSFRLTLAPATSTESITGDSKTLNNRTYDIKLNLS